MRSHSLWMYALAVAVACGGKPQPTKPANTAVPASGDELVAVAVDAPPGLNFELSEGSEAAGGRAAIAVPPASKLPDARADALLARMPTIAGSADDERAFALRERSLPPPRTGDTITDAFPPPPSGAAAPAVTEGPLQVLRFAPEGEVPLAPHLSLTFSQPMVAITSHDHSVAAGVPVKITPQPPGAWRWVGTRTLLFEPKPRLPMATTYNVTVPAGTQSATGNSLPTEVSFSFGTPAPTLQSSWPNNGPHDLKPVMFALFDQKIDATAVLGTMHVKAGRHSYQVRAATEAEIAGETTVKNLVDAAERADHGDRWIAFRVAEQLPKDTVVSVVIGPNTPSAEGPRRTASPQSFSFRTYAPLRVEEARCSYRRTCPPMAPWYIRFNNPLDPELFDQASLQVAPTLPGFKADLFGDHLNLRGRSKGNTTYTVTLPAGLTDRFGQTLGKAEEFTFRVGAADPTLWGPGGFVVLDPAAASPRFSVYSINHEELRVRAYQVQPTDWHKFELYMRAFNRSRTPPTPPGKQVMDELVRVEGKRDELTETTIDLSKALPTGKGQLVVTVLPTKQPRDSHYVQIVQGWYQATDIGLDAFVDQTDLYAWATQLSDGAPLADVDLSIWPSKGTARSDARGLGTIELATKPQEQSHLLIATRGDDLAILPEQTGFWSDYTGWRRTDPADALRWFVFDDRAMYKPGEQVHIKGWLRRMPNRKGADFVALGGAADKLSYRLVGPQGNEITKGSAQVNKAGGFNLELTLPKTPNLGRAHLELTAVGKGGDIIGRRSSHSFQIQEFRRPEFEVKSQVDTTTHLVGGHADITVKANYYAGGGLQNADTHWNVTASEGSFTPPNRDEFTFGSWIPWWNYRGITHNSDTQQKQLESKTDAAGAHHLRVDFLSSNPPRPMSLSAQATVMDVNRQAWATTSTVLVHPAELYVGLKSNKVFVEQGKPLEIQAIAVDLEGKAVPGTQITVRAVRLDWRIKKGEWTEVQQDPQDCKVTSAEQAVTCTFATKEGGRYQIRAVVTDASGRINETKFWRWVSGGKRPPTRNVEIETVELIPNQKEYKPGQTAEILLQAPFYPAEALISYRRNGIVKTERMRITEPTATLRVPIEDLYTPNLHLQVDLVGATERLGDDGTAAEGLPKRPAYGTGSLNLSIPPHHRTLAVKVTPAAKKIEPGGSTTIEVQVTDASGAPVSGAELAVVVVDESVLALTGYNIGNPVDSFYWSRPAGVADYHNRGYVQLARPDVESFGNGDDNAQQAVSATGGEMDDDGMVMKQEAGAMAPDEAAPPPAPSATRAPARALKSKKVRGGSTTSAPIAVRSDFNALATFAPEVPTDSRGRAQVKVKVPDNLTRYRVTVIAVSGTKHYGKGESNITARMPLMVRPSPPRFLNFGDKFELPVVLQNQTDAPMTVDVAVRTANATLTDGSGRQVTVPPNDRVEVRFPTAARKAGTARFQIAAASGKWADAAELSLPVWTPATTEAFATYGEIDKGAIKQPIELPPDVVTEFGGLEITTSSTQLQALTDAFLYLVQYPFDSSEAMASRILAIAGLRDVLTAFEAKGMPSAEQLQKVIDKDLKDLGSLQNWDGGFSWWRRGDPSWPYISIHGAHALARAKDKGYSVPEQMIKRSTQYLQEIRSHIPSWYPLEVRWSLEAYALSVRKRLGDGEPKRARELLREATLDKLPMEATGWLLYCLAGDKDSTTERKQIYKHLNNRASETAATAAFTTNYTDGAHLLLHSSRRTDAIILEALIVERPKSDLIAKVTRGLLAHRTRGRWSNTQENAFVLLTMDLYFHTYEGVTPNFVARAWIGDGFAGEHKFRGRSTDYHAIKVPMQWLAAQASKRQDLVLQKTGRGRLYYRIGMSYAPASLKLTAADHGFAVERSYEAVDNPGDVTRAADGTWKLKAGTRVRVRLTMVAQSRRYHVALVDPLPAGLEPMNPALAVTGAVPGDPKELAQAHGRYWWWWRTWYEHQNMRDDRVEAFTTMLWEGVHSYTYVTRATTPGEFVVPPTKAEEMYFPETFGRSASDRVVVY